MIGKWKKELQRSGVDVEVMEGRVCDCDCDSDSIRISLGIPDVWVLVRATQALALSAPKEVKEKM